MSGYASYNDGQLRLVCDPVGATLARYWNGQEQGCFACSREVATAIGVFLLRATGSDSSWSSEQFYGVSDNATLDVAVEDGVAILTVNGCNNGDALDDDDTVDLATRLIVFGGAA